MKIDTDFDVRSDANGLDPDKYSNTLRSYHKALWSKRLPCWRLFELEEGTEGQYLNHASDLGNFHLSSDSIIHEYSTWKRMSHIIDKIPLQEITKFRDLSYTIGWFILFPGNRIGGNPTINQERGCNNRICDRFDLTLECIRLHYASIDSPIGETLGRYADFFALFENFKGYCEFFLLNDLLLSDSGRIDFFMPFKGFDSSPLPSSAEEYHSYKNKCVGFVTKRNKRIEAAL